MYQAVKREERYDKYMPVMGYGTVGSGVVEVIDTNGERIAQRIGDALNVKYVLDIRDFPEDPIQEKIIHGF